VLIAGAWSPHSGVSGSTKADHTNHSGVPVRRRDEGEMGSAHPTLLEWSATWQSGFRVTTLGTDGGPGETETVPMPR
jgi:hypothetical protein